jgi:S-adenosylmethionine hydrolase
MRHEAFEVVNITAEHYFLSTKGSTFHARDIFAPVAAYLARGVNIHNFGDPIEDYQKIPLPFPQITGDNVLQGEVIMIDKFGNAITNIRVADIRKIYSAGKEGVLNIMLKDVGVNLKKYYAQVRDKGLYALLNSSGYLEFFVYRGSASDQNDISIGDIVEISVMAKQP